ncbi:MAG: hypothetical protein JO023_12775 [Chloroflexi bacterium]|nr:hypothetical protein [Chloroflexota bacterium]
MGDRVGVTVRTTRKRVQTAARHLLGPGHRIAKAEAITLRVLRGARRDPPPTTIRQPPHQLGAALGRLLERLAGRTSAQPCQRFTPELVVRASSQIGGASI